MSNEEVKGVLCGLNNNQLLLSRCSSSVCQYQSNLSPRPHETSVDFSNKSMDLQSLIVQLKAFSSQIGGI